MVKLRFYVTLIINYSLITIFCMQNTIYFIYINMINIQLISRPEKVCIFMVITQTHNWSVFVKCMLRVFIRTASLRNKKKNIINHQICSLTVLLLVFAPSTERTDNLYQDNTGMRHFLFCINAFLFPCLYHMRKS